MTRDASFLVEDEEAFGREDEQEHYPTALVLPLLLSDRLPAKVSEWSGREGHVKFFRGPLSSSEASIDALLHGDVFRSVVAYVGVPQPTHALDALIQTARQSILTLEDGWDDGDATGYEGVTIDRAANLLNRLAAIALTRRNELPLPVLRPADAGSIDLYWSDETRTLLINVPENSLAPATYSGRRSSADTIAGTVDLTEGRVSHLASWLSE